MPVRQSGKVDRSLLFVMNVRQSEVVCLWSEVMLLRTLSFFARTSEGGRHSSFNQVYLHLQLSVSGKLVRLLMTSTPSVLSPHVLLG